MTFGKKGESIEVETNGIKIESSDCIRLFGVDINNKLKFNEHVSNICTKASQLVGVLMRMKNMIPTRAKLQLYKAAIYHISLIVTLSGIFAVLVIKGN
jgi:hypothetical protein